MYLNKNNENTVQAIEVELFAGMNVSTLKYLEQPELVVHKIILFEIFSRILGTSLFFKRIVSNLGMYQGVSDSNPPLIVAPNSQEVILSRNSSTPRFQDFRKMSRNSSTPRFQEIGAKRREKNMVFLL